MKKFLKSFKYAANGVKQIFLKERNFRIDTVMALLVVVCSFVFSLDKWEKCVVFSLCALVLSLEAVNSAVERAIDCTAKGFDPLAGAAKDMAAGACLIACAISAAIGLYIFLPHVISFFLYFNFYYI